MYDVYASYASYAEQAVTATYMHHHLHLYAACYTALTHIYVLARTVTVYWRTCKNPKQLRISGRAHIFNNRAFSKSFFFFFRIFLLHVIYTPKQISLFSFTNQLFQPPPEYTHFPLSLTTHLGHSVHSVCIIIVTQRLQTSYIHIAYSALNTTEKPKNSKLKTKKIAQWDSVIFFRNENNNNIIIIINSSCSSNHNSSNINLMAIPIISLHSTAKVVIPRPAVVLLQVLLLEYFLVATTIIIHQQVAAQVPPLNQILFTHTCPISKDTQILTS